MAHVTLRLALMYTCVAHPHIETRNCAAPSLPCCSSISQRTTPHSFEKSNPFFRILLLRLPLVFKARTSQFRFFRKQSSKTIQFLINLLASNIARSICLQLLTGNCATQFLKNSFTELSTRSLYGQFPRRFGSVHVHFTHPFLFLPQFYIIFSCLFHYALLLKESTT